MSRRMIVMRAEIAVEVTGDASLETIARGYENGPMLPFVINATQPTRGTCVFPTRVRVDSISEQASEKAA